MNNIQKWILIISALLAASGLFLHGLTGRYQWQAGQDFGRDGTYYPPRLIDTWTGKDKPH